MDSHDLTALTDYTKFRAVRFNFFAKKLFINTTYAFDGSTVCAPAFFCRFLIKKIKRLARAKNDVVFIFFYFARN